MQAERLVALAPAVAGPLILFDDDRRHTKLAKTRAKCNAALSAADDDDIGLLRIAEFGGFGLAFFLPGPAFAVVAVLRAHRATDTLWFLMALQFAHGGEQGPDQPVLQADVAVTAGDTGLELEPAFGDAIAFRSLLLHILHQARGFDGGKLARQHVADLLTAFQRLQVPGEGHEVAPVTIGLKQVDGGVYVSIFQRIAELGKNRVDFGGGTDIKHIHLLHGAWSDGGAAKSPPRKPTAPAYRAPLPGMRRRKAYFERSIRIFR
ncbi:hypothetical protein D3C86_1018450 [compost metagenome]